MATNATNPTPSRMTRVIRLLPSPRYIAATLTVEIVMAPLGLPLWAHLLFGVLELVLHAVLRRA